MHNSLYKFTHLKNHSPNHLLSLCQAHAIKFMYLVSISTHNNVINWMLNSPNVELGLGLVNCPEHSTCYYRRYESYSK